MSGTTDPKTTAAPPVGWWAWCAVGLAAVAALASLAAWSPSPGSQHSLCMTRRVFDLPCAGCGMTRALAALTRGRWAEAVALHPLSPVFALEAVVVWLAWAARNAGLVRLPTRRVVVLFLAGNAVVLILVWLLRWAFGTLPG